MNGILYIVPTPIGNLEDMTFRAVRILNECDRILAEDTRVSLKLCNHFNIKTMLSSFHKDNEHKVVHKYIEEIKNGKNIAVITDAGTPGISDPGFLIVRDAIKEQITIDCLPGATAFVPALIQSGFPTDRFLFEGFLPQKKGRKTKLEEFINEERTIIFYESTHRILKTLEQLKELMPSERQISISRELTKKFEENIRGTISDVLKYYQTNPIKGEFVVVLSGCKLKF